mmetsp:Transcript_19809/g.39275  ORF Transcript_19809/g.39275 Transcript_19809/m.39275 type:complete len:226 (+) Transcript_19809:842-1519(+)
MQLASRSMFLPPVTSQAKPRVKLSAMLSVQSATLNPRPLESTALHAFLLTFTTGVAGGVTAAAAAGGAGRSELANKLRPAAASDSWSPAAASSNFRMRVEPSLAPFPFRGQAWFAKLGASGHSFFHGTTTEPSGSSLLERFLSSSSHTSATNGISFPPIGFRSKHLTVNASSHVGFRLSRIVFVSPQLAEPPVRPNRRTYGSDLPKNPSAFRSLTAPHAVTTKSR